MAEDNLAVITPEETSIANDVVSGEPLDYQLKALTDPNAYHAPISVTEPTKAMQFLEQMLLIRKTEEKIAEMALAGEAKCPCHLAIGQEAVAAGVSAHLTPTDSIFGAHRSHGHYLGLGASVEALLCEVLGKETGCSKGMGGSMHLYSGEHGFKGSVPIVSGTVSLAAGAGLSAKVRGTQDVGVAYFGDGACEEGVVHEALNAAVSMGLPTLFVVENNLFSSHLDLAFRQPFNSTARFAIANGMAYAVVDGNDVNAVSVATEKLLTIARTEKKPVFLEAITYRHLGHVGPDANVDVGVRRSEEELALWKKRDPVTRLKEGLAMSDGDYAALEARLNEQVEAAYEVAKKAPMPKTDALLDRVYANTIRDTSGLPAADHSKTVRLNYGSAIREGYAYLLTHCEEFLILGQGVWSPWYVGNSMKDLDQEFGKERVIDTPVSENACTGITVGAGLAGVRPMVIHPRIDFMLYAMDPIVNQAAKWGHMLGGQTFPAVAIRGIINRGGEQGAQHSQALQSWFAHIPGLRVVMPSTVADARDLLIASILSDDPVVYIDDRWLYEQEAEVTATPKLLDLSKEGPAILKEGTDITIVGSSFSTRLALDAAEELEKKNVSAEVIDLRVLNPLDASTIIASVEKTGRLLVVDGSWLSCGMSAEIIARVSEAVDLSSYKASPKRIGLAPSAAPTSKALEEIYYPSVSHVVEEALGLIQ